MSLKSNLQAVWPWLTDDKNQKTLMFVGGALVAIATALTQLGFFAVKPSVVINKPAATAPITATPAPAASAPVVASAPVDPAARPLLDDIARKKDQAERERQDEREAWQLALQLNTVAGYQAYLSEYPNGRHARFALASIDKLRSPVNTLPVSAVASEVAAPASSVAPAPLPRPEHPRRPVTKPAHPPAVQPAHTPPRKPAPKPATTPTHKPPPKPVTPAAPPAKPARIIVQCSEGTKLYIDGIERGRITTNLFGTFTIKLEPGKHALLLKTSQGVLQQDMELQSGQTLRLNPPLCGN